MIIPIIEKIKIHLLQQDQLSRHPLFSKEHSFSNTIQYSHFAQSIEAELSQIAHYDSSLVLDKNREPLLPKTLLALNILEDSKHFLGSATPNSTPIKTVAEHKEEGHTISDLIQLFMEENPLELTEISQAQAQKYIKLYISVIYQEKPLLPALLSKIFLDNYYTSNRWFHSNRLSVDLKTLYDKLNSFFYKEHITPEDIALSCGIYLDTLLEHKEPKLVKDLISKALNQEISLEGTQENHLYLKFTHHPLYILGVSQESKTAQLSTAVRFLQKEAFPQLKIAVLKSDIIKRRMIKNYYNLSTNILQQRSKQLFADFFYSRELFTQREMIDPFEDANFEQIFFTN